MRNVHAHVGAGFLASLGAVQQFVVREQAKVRWWYVVHTSPGQQMISQWDWAGPIQATDSKLYKMITDELVKNPKLTFYRLVYSPLQKIWIWDLRYLSTLSSGSEGIPGYDNDPTTPVVSGAAPRIGTIDISPPLTGRWPYVGFPPRVTMLGGEFHLAKWKWPKQGIAAQYREAIPSNSRHLYVLRNGQYIVSHRDEVNPDMGNPSQHFIRDVMKRPASVTPLEADLRRKASPI